MNELDLFAAIGSADDCYLDFSAPVISHRPLRRILLAAAMISLLVITVFAAPLLFNAIQRAQLEYVGQQEIKFTHFDSRMEAVSTLTGQEAVYSIEMEITPASNLPEIIETLYLPASVPGNWENEERLLHSAYGTFTCKWDIVSEEGYIGVIYQQWPLSGQITDGVCVHQFHADVGAEVESSMLVADGFSVLEVSKTSVIQPLMNADLEVAGGYTTAATRDYFWSDGQYLFRLCVPFELEFDTVKPVISNLKAIGKETVFIID